MIRFPLTDGLNQQECYHFLLDILHPQGLCCPYGHLLPKGPCPHRRDRAPILDYRCRECGTVFNVFTGTVWASAHDSCAKIILILRGLTQGIPTLPLADEWECDDETRLHYRHPIQAAALQNRDRSPLVDTVTEGDEGFQNAGEKGDPHRDPIDPPRIRANPRRGRGTMAHDRPPIQGVVGRETGEIRWTVGDDTRPVTLPPEVESKTEEGATFYSDESSADHPVEASGRPHSTVCHAQQEYARDEDGDGVREVHGNTMEGIWTGLRNFLRPFRGIHKGYLAQYVALFEWAHNLKRVTREFLQILISPRFIQLPT